jgi:hypothetical protein
MAYVARLVRGAYARRLSGQPDGERYERAGEVPVIRDGRRVYEDLDVLALRDMPAILDALKILEEEARSGGAIR